MSTRDPCSEHMGRHVIAKNRLLGTKDQHHHGRTRRSVKIVFFVFLIRESEIRISVHLPMKIFIFFKWCVFLFQGSTVNMNVMGLVYERIKDAMGSTGHTTLGITLMIGKSSLSYNTHQYGQVVCFFSYSLTCATASTENVHRR